MFWVLSEVLEAKGVCCFCYGKTYQAVLVTRVASTDVQHDGIMVESTMCLQQGGTCPTIVAQAALLATPCTQKYIQNRHIKKPFGPLRAAQLSSNRPMEQ
jgi:hypothetical protein